MEVQPRLPRVVQSLRRTYEEVDPLFIKLGEDLQKIHTGACQLTDLMVNAARLTDAESEEGIPSCANRIARHSLGQLEDCQAEVSRRLGQIELMEDNLHSLHNKCAMIQSTALSLRVVCLNMELESARSIEAREMFGNFVKETPELAGRIAKISAEITNQCALVGASLAHARQGMTRGLAHLRHLTGSASHAVQNTVGQIGLLVQMSARGMEGTAGHSHQISGQVSEIVMALQFHDISRQQVDHVIEAIEDAQRLCAEVTSGENSKYSNPARMEVMGAVYGILSIQAGQLNKVISEIEAASEKLDHAFEDLMHRVDKLSTESSISGSENPNQASEEDLMAGLNSALDQLRSFVGQGYALSDQAKEAATVTSAAASRFLEYVDEIRSISRELRLRALNAIIKTAHLGEDGKTLEVLSHAVEALSDQTDRLVLEIVGNLECIDGCVAELTGRASEQKPCSQKEGEPAGQSLDALIERVSDGYGRFRLASSEAIRQSGDLKMLLSQSKTGLVFISDLREQLHLHLKELQGIAESMDRWSGPSGGKRSAEIDAIAGRYTMERERYVHELVISKGEETARSPIGDETPLTPEVEKDPALRKEDEHPENSVEFF